MYTIEELLEYVKGKPTIKVKIAELTWMYTTDRISKKRLDAVVIDGFPVIVKRLANGKLVTLDGFHRVYKAWKEGRKTIDAFMITEADIAKLKKESRVSIEDKDAVELGEEISRVREFAEDKGLDEETVDDFVKNAIDKHEEASVESWLDRQHAGSYELSLYMKALIAHIDASVK